MYISSDDAMYKMISELLRFTNDRNDLLTFVCGLEEKDMNEFTEKIKKIKSNDMNELLENFVYFRNSKGYKIDEE